MLSESMASEIASFWATDGSPVNARAIARNTVFIIILILIVHYCLLFNNTHESGILQTPTFTLQLFLAIIVKAKSVMEIHFVFSILRSLL